MDYQNFNLSVVVEDFETNFIRNLMITKGFQRYEELLDFEGPFMSVYCEGGNIKYISDMSTWERLHNELSNMLEEDNEIIDKIIDDYGFLTLLEIKEAVELDELDESNIKQIKNNPAVIKAKPNSLVIAVTTETDKYQEIIKQVQQQKKKRTKK